MLRVTSDSSAISAGTVPSPRSAKADESSSAPDSFASLVDTGANTTAEERPPIVKDQPSPRQTDKVPAENQPAQDVASRSPTATYPSSEDVDIAELHLLHTSANIPALPKIVASVDLEIATPAKKADASDSGAAGPEIPPTDTQAIQTPTQIAAAIPVTGSPTISIAIPVAVKAPLSIASAAINASTTESSTPSPAASSTNPAGDPTDSSATRKESVSPANPAYKAAEASFVLPVSVGEANAASTTPSTAPDVAAAAVQVATAASGVIAPNVFRTGYSTPAAARSTVNAANNSVDSSSTVSPDFLLEAGSEIASVHHIGNNADARSLAGDKPIIDGSAIAAQRDAASSDTFQPLAASHQHTAVTVPDQAQTGLSASSGQTVGSLQQPQQQQALAPINQLTVAVATTAAMPLNAVPLQIAVAAQSGKSRFEIRLDPAELGRIDVRIDIDRQGQVTSHLTVEKPETLALLRQDAPHLQRALDDAGLKTGNSGLQFSLRDQSSSGQNNGQDSGRHAQRLIVSDDDSLLATTAGRTYGRMLTSSSGVDIRV